MHKQYVCIGTGPVLAEFNNRQPECWTRLTADNADFRDFDDRVTLAGLGIFSIDRAAHRAARQLQALLDQRVADAYVYLGLDRKAEQRRIAGEVIALGLVPDGCWPRSTGAYAARAEALDREVVAAAERIRVSERYFREIAEDHVVIAVFALA